MVGVTNGIATAVCGGSISFRSAHENGRPNLDNTGIDKEGVSVGKCTAIL
jgi:hypothetical protein